MLAEDLEPAVFDTLVAGGEAAAAQARARGSLFRDEPIDQDVPPDPTAETQEPDVRAAQDVIGIGFTARNPLAINWAETFSSTQIVEVSAATRRAVREIITDAFIEGLPPRTAARRIRSLVGLTSAQKLAVQRLAERMTDPDNFGRTVTAFRRRDPATGRTISKLHWKIPPRGPSTALVNRATNTYSKRLLNWRARNIARTETLMAANEGQRQLWLQSKQRGDLPSDVKRVWIVTPDSRLCPICRPMAGQPRALDELFTTGIGTKVIGPPAHQSCRCATGLVRDAGLPKSPTVVP